MPSKRKTFYILHDMKNGVIVGKFDGDEMHELIGISKSNINKFNIDSGLLYKKRYAVEYDSLSKTDTDIPKDVWKRWDDVRRNVGMKLKTADETARKQALRRMRDKELERAKAEKS